MKLKPRLFLIGWLVLPSWEISVINPRKFQTPSSRWTCRKRVRPLPTTIGYLLDQNLSLDGAVQVGLMILGEVLDYAD